MPDRDFTPDRADTSPDRSADVTSHAGGPGAAVGDDDPLGQFIESRHLDDADAPASTPDAADALRQSAVDDEAAARAKLEAETEAEAKAYFALILRDAREQAIKDLTVYLQLPDGQEIQAKTSEQGAVAVPRPGSGKGNIQVHVQDVHGKKQQICTLDVARCKDVVVTNSRKTMHRMPLGPHRPAATASAPATGAASAASSAPAASTSSHGTGTAARSGAPAPTPVHRFLELRRAAGDPLTVPGLPAATHSTQGQDVDFGTGDGWDDARGAPPAPPRHAAPAGGFDFDFGSGSGWDDSGRAPPADRGQTAPARTTAGIASAHATSAPGHAASAAAHPASAHDHGHAGHGAPHHAASAPGPAASGAGQPAPDSCEVWHGTDRSGNAVTLMPCGQCPNPDNLRLGYKNPFRGALIDASRRGGMIPQALCALVDCEAKPWPLTVPLLNPDGSPMRYRTGRHRGQVITKTLGSSWIADCGAGSTSAAGLTQFEVGTWLLHVFRTGYYIREQSIRKGWILETTQADEERRQGLVHSPAASHGRRARGPRPRPLVRSNSVFVLSTGAHVINPEAHLHDPNVKACLNMRIDPYWALNAAADYGHANLQILKGAGFNLNGLNDMEVAKLMYMMHHEGEGGGVAFARNRLVETHGEHRLTTIFHQQIGATKAQDAIDEADGDVAVAYRYWFGNTYVDPRFDHASETYFCSSPVRAAKLSELLVKIGGIRIAEVG